MKQLIKDLKQGFYNRFIKAYVDREIEARRKEIRKKMNETYAKDILDLFDEACEQYIGMQNKKREGIAYSQKQAIESVRLFFESKLSR